MVLIFVFIPATDSGWSSNHVAKSCKVLKSASALPESNCAANSSLAIVRTLLLASWPTSVTTEPLKVLTLLLTPSITPFNSVLAEETCSSV